LAAKHRSITLAAQELMVTPPAVSKQVKQLEDMVEIKLIFRNGNSIELTEMGQKLYKKCIRIFDQIKEMENFLEDISRAKSGVLRIGCPQSIAKYVIPHLISSFKKTYPGIRILLDQGNNSEMIKSVINHQNELALCRPRPNEKRLKVKTFRREDLVLVLSPDSNNVPTDQISVPQLSTIPLILAKYGSATRDVVFEYFKKFKMTPTIVMESDTVDLTKELVSNDHGASFLLRSAVQEDILNKKLRSVRILEGSPTIELGVAYHKRESLSPGAWAFLRLLEKSMETPPRSNAD
jgi:DNA-binding transcriptional LysR family regulator